MSNTSLSSDELLALDHNDHEGAFRDYLKGSSRHLEDKHAFLIDWVKPGPEDQILECGSSSGKTCVDFARHAGCYCLGIDFDPAAVAVANTMRDQHFPELAERCQFECDSLETMSFSRPFNKVLMPDFSEHIPDEVFAGILDNLRRHLPGARLYVYTPLRSHIFEVMKHRNIILKNKSGHINVKTERELVDFLEAQGWRVESVTRRVSSIPVFKYLEMVLGRVPGIGPLFHRRIALVARPAES
jgi:SAM-dependent methyltransferase